MPENHLKRGIEAGWHSIMAMLIVLVFILDGASYANTFHAKKTGQNCQTCHKKTTILGKEWIGGINETGQSYKVSGYVWPPLNKVILPLGRISKSVIGYVHLVAVFLWIGTILYVHIILRPAYASKGLPSKEVRLGVVSMIVVGITGLILTLSRVNSLGVLFGTGWGRMLLIKIGLFLLLVSTAAFVILYLAPRLRPGMRAPRAIFPKGGVFDPVTLLSFDGKDGRPAYFALRGTVYDVTGHKDWAEGAHFKHFAGMDLSRELSEAPHGEEILKGLKALGTYNALLKPPATPEQKLFYVVADAVLVVVFVQLLVIAVWRWGY